VEKHSFVMMIDDDRSVLNILTRVLELEGCTESSEIVREVLNRLENSQPNLVIMDIETPDMESPEVLQILNESAGAPAIVLTAHCEVTTLREALAACTSRGGVKPGSSEIVAGMLTKFRKAVPRNIASN